MILSSKALIEIKSNTLAKNLLAVKMNRSVHTIEKWIKDNDIMLTTADALEVIKQETGLTDEEILEKEEATTGA